MNFNKDLFASLVKDDDRLVAFSDTSAGEVTDWLPTLLPQVDATMMGGFPLSGRVTEVYGQPSVGKSTLTDAAMSVAQKIGVLVILFDVEGTTSRERLKAVGVDPQYIISYRPVRKKDGTIDPITIEDVFSTIINLSAEVHSKDPHQPMLFVWDTVAMTQPRMVADMSIGQQAVGQQARALSEGIRKVNVNLMGNNASLIALNQARADIGGNAFINEMKTVGGNAWQHEMSLRLAMKRSKKITVSSTDKEEVGHWATLKFAKSKIGDNAGKFALTALLHQTGLDMYYNVFEEAVMNGLVTGTQWKSYQMQEGDNKGQEVKKRNKEWVDFLKSDEGKDVFGDMWRSLVKIEFPKCYPPLFNLNVPLDKNNFPFIGDLQQYYIDIQEKLEPEQQHTNYVVWKKNQKKAKK